MHLQCGITIFVISDKVSPLPIIGKFYTIKSVICKLSRKFLKIENLLLLRIEVRVLYFPESHFLFNHSMYFCTPCSTVMKSCSQPAVRNAFMSAWVKL